MKYIPDLFIIIIGIFCTLGAIVAFITFILFMSLMIVAMYQALVMLL
jgi:hypothetical protein